MAPFSTPSGSRDATVEIPERVLDRISVASNIDRSIDAIRRSWETLARTQPIHDGVNPAIHLVQEVDQLVENVVQQEQALIRQRDDGSMLSMIGRGFGLCPPTKDL